VSFWSKECDSAQDGNCEKIQIARRYGRDTENEEVIVEI
jgi:hypothetical protein